MLNSRHSELLHSQLFQCCTYPLGISLGPLNVSDEGQAWRNGPLHLTGIYSWNFNQSVLINPDLYPNCGGLASWQSGQ